MRFSDEGARVALVARSRDDLEKVADEAEGETLVATADVRNADDVERAVDAVTDEFGSVDTLVNNAGVSLMGMNNERSRLIDVSEGEWDTVIETNLKGVFLFSKHVLPHMIERERGNIVNVSSGLGKHAVPEAIPYVSSKWGLEGFTKALALEYEDDGVNVNGLSPGGQVNTGIWEHLPDEHREQILQPDVMDDAAVMLAELGPGDVTGESMHASAWEDELG